MKSVAGRGSDVFASEAKQSIIDEFNGLLRFARKDGSYERLCRGFGGTCGGTLDFGGTHNLAAPGRKGIEIGIKSGNDQQRHDC